MRYREVHIVKTQISVIIPIYGCPAAIPELYRRLTEVLKSISPDYEILMVNDGCPQNSWDSICKLCDEVLTDEEKKAILKFSDGYIKFLNNGKTPIHDEIIQLYDGYDTIVSENANNITNDVKYMLSIARVILKHPRVLLFDETLTAFPKEVDLKLIDYFKKTKGKHNVVIISKEKHVIEEADQVIYMEKGENVATGKHETLLLKSAKYKKYFNEL